MRFASHHSAAVVMAGVFLTSPGQIGAAVIRAKSVSLKDVSSALASASDGDTVLVPAGKAGWTSPLTITKGITLEGAGNDATVILDDISREKHREAPPPRAPLFSKSLTSGAVGSPKMIQSILRIQLGSRQSFRLTGFTFQPGSLTIPGSYGVYLEGTCPSIRIDHCHFDQIYRGEYLRTVGWLYGVVDHCVFDCRTRCQSMVIWHDGWGGHSDGDGSWADPPYFGSEKFIFIEDNIINNVAGPTQTTASIDAWAGARYVCRYNTFNNTVATNHGLESSRRRRGCRVTEIYKNTFNFTRIPAVAGISRSGTMLLYDNTWKGNPLSRGKALKCFRQQYVFPPWGGANGNNPWDSNDPHGLYTSGKHDGADASQKLVVANAAWTPDQWAGFSLTNTTTGRFSFITSNTSDTITYFVDNSFGHPPTYMSFNKGDRFEIRKLLIALDQPGRGKGDLIAGGNDNPINTTTKSASWAHQALEPVYSWNNTYEGTTNVNVSNGEPPYPTLKENRDFYNDTAMPGYKSYTYPHPLVIGTPGSPKKPRPLGK
jgi:hypothetical protein